VIEYRLRTERFYELANFTFVPTEGVLFSALQLSIVSTNVPQNPVDPSFDYPSAETNVTAFFKLDWNTSASAERPEIFSGLQLAYGFLGTSVVRVVQLTEYSSETNTFIDMKRNLYFAHSGLDSPKTTYTDWLYHPPPTSISVIIQSPTYFILQRAERYFQRTDLIVFIVLVLIALYSPLSVLVRLGLWFEAKCCGKKRTVKQNDWFMVESDREEANAKLLNAKQEYNSD